MKTDPKARGKQAEERGQPPAADGEDRQREQRKCNRRPNKIGDGQIKPIA
ncbi:hypothetical protein SDC9_176837 [bioreactor metagenome]|uniref:Uncharacterized protein n=1 Tax=bioreactor metagenome TaxID=1076179 RepID=A0A645GZA7_9ZZZZ